MTSSIGGNKTKSRPFTSKTARNVVKETSGFQAHSSQSQSIAQLFTARGSSVSLRDKPLFEALNSTSGGGGGGFAESSYPPSSSRPSTSSGIRRGVGGGVGLSSSSKKILHPQSGNGTRPSTARPPTSGQQPTSLETTNKPPIDIVIHVFDESRNVTRDFHCKKSLLLREMKYFSAIILADKSKQGYIEIDVHSDVLVFEKLMDYCFNHEIHIDTKNVIGILISSYFLGMSLLVESCLKYMKSCIDDILKVPIDFSCINDELVRRLSLLFRPEELLDIFDPKNKLKGKLYMEKLETLASEKKIESCLDCKTVFSCEMLETLECHLKIPKIDWRGNLSRTHTRDPAFDLNIWVSSIYLSTGLDNWEICYWKIWSILNTLNCKTCNQAFRCIDYNECCQHPQPTTASENGLCRVCQKPMKSFSLFDIKKGCRHFQHEIDESDPEKEKIFLKVKYLLMESHAPGFSSSCTHPSDNGAVSQINRNLFQSWIPANQKSPIVTPPTKPLKTSKQFAQREVDVERMQTLINSLVV